MATSDGHEHVTSEIVKLNNVATVSTTCMNCKLLEKRLQNVLSELKSGEEILSILREDSISITTRQTADQQACASPSDHSVHGVNSVQEYTSETWKTVAQNSNNRKKTCGSNVKNSKMNFAIHC
jgi:hypothetical protein